MTKHGPKGQFLAALSRLTVRVDKASDSEVERWWDGFEEYIDRMKDQEAIGERGTIRDPRK